MCNKRSYCEYLIQCTWYRKIYDTYDNKDSWWIILSVSENHRETYVNKKSNDSWYNWLTTKCYTYMYTKAWK